MTDFKKGDFILVRPNTSTAWRLAIFHSFHGFVYEQGAVKVMLHDVGPELHIYKLWKPLPTSTKPNKDKWMVSADGRHAPSHIHDTFSEACAEAKRLIEDRNARRTRVLRLERTYVCKRIAVEEEPNA